MGASPGPAVRHRPGRLPSHPRLAAADAASPRGRARARGRNHGARARPDRGYSAPDTRRLQDRLRARVRSLTVLYGGVLGDLGGESAEAGAHRAPPLPRVRRSRRPAPPQRRHRLPAPSGGRRHAEHPARARRPGHCPSGARGPELVRRVPGLALAQYAKSATRYLRRLEKRFGDRLSLRIFRGASEGDRVFTDLGIVARKTYQHALGVAFAQRQLERRIVTLLMERGWFRAYVLYLDGEPISFWHGHAYRGAFVTGVPGYDPAYRSPGRELRPLPAHRGPLRRRRLRYPGFRLERRGIQAPPVDAEPTRAGRAPVRPQAKGCLTNVARSSLLTTVTGVRSLLARAEMIDPIKRRWRDSVTSNGSSVVRS